MMAMMKLWYRKRTGLLCENYFKRPSKLDTKCNCQYLHHKNPYLLLGPFKYEKLNLIPEVGYFHEIVSDTECDGIIKEALPKLKPTAYTLKKKGAEPIHVKYSPQRTSKNTFIDERDPNSVTKIISQRIELATRVKMHDNAMKYSNTGDDMNMQVGSTRLS